LFHRHLDELTDSRLIDRSEGVLLDDLQLLVRPEEGTRIVAAHSEASLRQVIRAEAEELRRLSDLIGRERSAWHLNHRPDQIAQLHAFLFHYFGGDAMNNLNLQIELLLEAHERNHNLRIYFNSRFLHVRCRFEDRTRLHFG